MSRHASPRPRPRGPAAARLSGPVTESNGLRDEDRLRARRVGRGRRRRRGRRIASGGTVERFSSAPRLAPTMCMIPCASRNAASATSSDDDRPEVAFEKLVDGHGRGWRMTSGSCPAAYLRGTCQPQRAWNHRLFLRAADLAIRQVVGAREGRVSATKCQTARPFAGASGLIPAPRRASGRWCASRCRAAARRGDLSPLVCRSVSRMTRSSISSRGVPISNVSGVRRARRRRGDASGQIALGERVAARQDDGALDHVLELAHVAGPGVVEQPLERAARRREARRGRSSRSRGRGSARRAAGCPRGARAAAAR